MSMKVPSKNQFRQYIWSATLVIAFFGVIYGYTNWRADQVQRQFLFYYDWELSIPLIPWMILPYFSLTILMVVPLFYLKPSEIRRLARTMAVATVIAGTIFYVFPAPIGLLRPDSVPGFWNKLYQILWSIDRTNNTIPSLHITFTFIIILAIWLKVKLSQRIFFSLWGVGICFAAIFTWQHHVWDVLTGIILAITCDKMVSQIPDDENYSWEI